MTLRPYQQEAHDAVSKWIRKSTTPCLVEAATGSGKSHIIAALATTVHELSKGKRVLVLQPSAELVEQNAEKYRATGSRCSIFSASLGQKSMTHPVVFGTPLTVKNHISRFGNQFGAVIIDECHGMTPTVISIIDKIRDENPYLRVIGLSATPYRMGKGYIFATFANGRPVSRDKTETPYFGQCVYRISARSLIDQGFLTPPIVGEIGTESYQTLKMQLNARGQYNASDVDEAFHGHGRKTAAIIADIVARAVGRSGVMIFAATVRHAEECMASLPGGLSAMVTGDTPKSERQRILTAFKARRIKYLVNVSVLTTGFDAPHVDVVAILRATESVGLLQQIIGRGLRLSDGKENCLILDYAENLERHCPEGDLFDPDIKARTASGEGSDIECACPQCCGENSFKARPNKENFDIDKNGYFLDLDGNRIDTDYGPMPAHFGRRCQNYVLTAGSYDRCTYLWSHRTCPHCEELNDIAARYCSKCKGEIIDPNEKLRIQFKALKKDPTQIQCDEVLTWNITRGMSRSENEVDRVDVVTPYRSFSFWVMVNPKGWSAEKARRLLDSLNGTQPETITYRKEPDSKFYTVYAYNRPKDEDPEQREGGGEHGVQRELPLGSSGAGNVLLQAS